MEINKYSFKEIEKKYSKIWNEKDYIKNKKHTKETFYCLDMFPYPSANGMHVGHWRGYVLSDVYARKKWLEGYELLHPMGWDAFGLPAENYAIKNKTHPQEIISKSIEIFRDQIKKIGGLYNWEKEINTTDKEYYKWTQWIFLKMYEAGLSYQADKDVNWCPSCKTGLSNEEVSKGLCERCHSPVIKKKVRQWVLKITEYAEELLEGLNKLNWPEKIKTMQRNWIGKSYGLNIDFKVDSKSKTNLVVYTTRPETLYGVSFLAITHDHQLLEEIIPQEYKNTVLNNLKVFLESNQKNEESQYEGVFLEAYALHPLTNQRLPIYVTRYVLSDYGTGSVMGVPAHDSRDYNFATKYLLPVKPVIMDPLGDNSKVYEGDGILFNSSHFDGINAKTNGRRNISDFLLQKKVATKKINYKMRDWIFSRQRYWGEPIPIIHCKNCGTVPVPEKDLPVVLPYVKNYEPTQDGTSPLSLIESWINIPCYICGENAKRETNTMPQWAGSCWYFLRYPDPSYDQGLCCPEATKKWLPVNLYVGGIEHAILHLLYARFYIKFLFEKNIISFDEPFLHLFNQGMINSKSKKTNMIEKMSKSKGNVVSPDDIIEKYGTDALRLYILFIAPPEIDSIWREDGVVGCYRFLKRFWLAMQSEEYRTEEYLEESEKVVCNFLKNFTDKINSFHTNTAVSEIMKVINLIIEKKIKLTSTMRKKIIINCSIMIPYICEELLKEYNTSIQASNWQEYNEEILNEDTMNIIIQVNGKFKNIMIINKNTSRSAIEAEAKEKVSTSLSSIPDQAIKIIYVQGKLINFVFNKN